MFLKFPAVASLLIMRTKIIQKAVELFLTLGFKSVTMDDIAHEMGISKKTIYVHFANKTKLVEAVTFELFETICDGIDGICEASHNPIEWNAFKLINVFCLYIFSRLLHINY